MLPAQLEQWLDRAVAQLRCRAAVQPVKAELKAHLEDQYEAFLAEEDSPEQAARKTVESMGDAVLVGGRLDEVHRPRSAWGPFLWVAMLFMLGTALRVFGELRLGPDGSGEVVSLLVRGCVPVDVLAVVYFGTDLVARMRHTWLIYGGALALVLGTALCTPTINGARIYARPLCGFLVLGYAAILYRQRGKRLAGLLLSGMAIVPLLLAALYLPALSQAICILLTGLVLCLYCGWRDWFGWGRGRSMGLTAAVAVGLPAIGCLSNPHLVERMLERSNPFSDPAGGGWLDLLRLTIWQGKSPLQPLTSEWADRVPENLFQGLTEESLFRLLGSDDPLTWSAHALGRPAALVLLGALIVCLVLLWRSVLRVRSAAGRMLALAAVAFLTAQLLLEPLNLSVPFLSGGVWSGSVQAVLAGVILSAFRLDPAKGGQEPAAARGWLHRDGKGWQIRLS